MTMVKIARLGKLNLFTTSPKTIKTSLYSPDDTLRVCPSKNYTKFSMAFKGLLCWDLIKNKTFS